MRNADQTTTAVVKGSLKNTQDGFCFGVRLTNARGCFLSILNGFFVEVDGTLYDRGTQRLSVNGKPPRSLEELKSCSDEHWDVRDTATLYIQKDGGLVPGIHSVVLETRLLDGYFKAQDYWLTDPPPLGEGPVGEPYRLELCGEEASHGISV